MTLFNEDAQLDKIQSSLWSCFKTYMQLFTMLRKAYAIHDMHLSQKQTHIHYNT